MVCTLGNPWLRPAVAVPIGSTRLAPVYSAKGTQRTFQNAYFKLRFLPVAWQRRTESKVSRIAIRQRERRRQTCRRPRVAVVLGAGGVLRGALMGGGLAALNRVTDW